MAPKQCGFVLWVAFLFLPSLGNGLAFVDPKILARWATARWAGPERAASQRLHSPHTDETVAPWNEATHRIQWSSAMAIMALWLPLTVHAVSGGGLDYANMDITGQDFSNANYKGKDFTQVIAKTTNFRGSNLQGCRFYKAYLVRTDFTSADLRGASLEDTSLDDAVLTNAVASGAYFSASIMDAKDLENADFTDAQFPAKTLALLCQRDDVKGTNPTTGADTRESLVCP